MAYMSVAVVAVLCTALLPLAEANVTVSYQMYSFSSNGRDDENRCCDPLWSCSCEPRFTFCFDYADRTNSMDQCAFGLFQTGEHSDNSFTFNPHDLNGIPNPIVVHVPTWPSSGVKMKVRVQDDDTGHSAHDDMDHYYETWNGPIHPWSLQTPPPEILHYHGTRQRTEHTTLVVYITGQCNRYYYGETCSVYCPQEDYSEATSSCDSGVVVFSPQGNPQPSNEDNSITTITSQSEGVSGLIIGLISAIFIAILVVVIALALVYRHKRNKKLRDQGVQRDADAAFDNPMYGDQNNVNTQTHAPSTGNMGSQAGNGSMASGLVLQPPAYTKGYSYTDHSEVVNKQRMMFHNQTSNSGAQTQSGVVYDNPQPVTQTGLVNDNSQTVGEDSEVYEAMALPAKVRR